MKTRNMRLFILIVCIFLLYFVSEFFLRCAAVANINPEKVNLNELLNSLPESVRDVVTYRIMYTDMTNALEKAETEQEKLSALAALGEYTRDLAEKERIFDMLRKKYPSNPGASAAFVYYLLKKDSPQQITVPEFHKYLASFPQLEQYNIWAQALNRLNQLKVPEKDKLDFMLPLLKIKPQYRDYSIFYEEIVKLATKHHQSEIANKADSLIDDCRLCDSIMDKLMELEEQTMKKAAEAQKKGK